MPTIYDINFNQFAVQNIPPDKRYSRMVAWVRILLSALQYLRDLWFGSYRTGSTANPWATGTYAKYDQVKYNKAVYESLIDGNTSNPTTVANWKVVQTNFIGLSERILYSGQKLVLEYALNKWFGTIFRQPPLQSDIYITNDPVGIAFFRSASAEDESSSVSRVGSSEYVINNYSFNVAFNFTIHVPAAVYNALDTTGLNNEKIFRAFASQYIPAGITYQIQTY